MLIVHKVEKQHEVTRSDVHHWISRQWAAKLCSASLTRYRLLGALAQCSSEQDSGWPSRTFTIGLLLEV
jgi:hypothetical protein